MDFISLSESVDTSTPMGKMVFTVIGAVVELERFLIRERAKKDGKLLGRPHGTNANIKRIKRLREQEMSLRNIASEVNVSKSTVSRALIAVP